MKLSAFFYLVLIHLILNFAIMPVKVNDLRDLNLITEVAEKVSMVKLLVKSPVLLMSSMIWCHEVKRQVCF